MAMRSDSDAAVRPKLGFRPLYQQVRDMFVQRMVEGRWTPGQALPSEIDLAAEVGVSQGTVRKALDAMAAERLVVRRQGRGTFVAEHDEARILFQFFKLVPDAGEPAFPESRVDSATQEPASMADAQSLQLKAGTPVLRIHRVRSLGGKPVVAETVVLPAGLFPGFVDGPIPNNLYGSFATRYGITVARAQERLKAVALDETDAAALGVPAGTAALLIDRLALGLDGLPVEWRLSRCLTADFHYHSDLT